MRDSYLLSPAVLSGMCMLLAFGGNSALHAAPIIPGLEHKHPLNEAQKGRVLIEELRCASCHDGIAGTNALSAPALGDVASRLNPDFLEKFISNPSAHDPGTTMPDVMSGKSEQEKSELASSLSAYLISLGDETTQPPIKENDSESGKKLFHETGCIACHSPRDGAGKALPSDVGLDHVSKKYTPGGLASFLHEPLKTRPSGRMPDMRLSRSEAELISAFLLGSAEKNPSPAKPASTPELIQAGKTAFTELRCIACHNVDETTTAAKVSLTKLDPSSGCLSEKPSTTPNYRLSEQQRSAIRAALDPKAVPITPAEKLNIHLTQLNCISCHQRDDFGGVSPERDSYFHSTEEALGNESRIPPPLTLAGAKLRPEWMNKVLLEGQTVRPYMTTRMPLFGNNALDGLTKLFSENDKLPPFDFPPIPKESEPMIRDGGHMLLGDQGLSCISCHNYNGIESPSMKGLDIMTSYQRLQPAWFNSFMRNPAKFRPGIIMPSYWPDDKAVQTEILNGDTDLQLQALWNQFSLGRSARDPSGLRAADPELIVTDKTRTYRGRSTVAGYRGIAVGFPGGMNYAFNAQTGALSSIWNGKFVTVGWRGQGSGNFIPAEKNIQLPQDVAFLTELPEKWPLHPIRTKENPVNPDPLYPRNHGYAFLGYSLDTATSIPTFRYKCGEVMIEETTQSSERLLERTFAFTSLKPTISFSAPMPETLWFRALTGDIKTVSENVFETADIRITVPPNSATLRPAENGGMELLLKITLTGGKSQATLGYELLR